MENKSIFIIGEENFMLKDYGELTWEEDEQLVSLLNPTCETNLDINKILSIILLPEDKSIDVSKYDFKQGKLTVIKKIIKEEIVKKRNDFLAV
ncbi:MAG: hypothetical protein V1773_01060 [bacterium]